MLVPLFEPIPFATKPTTSPHQPARWMKAFAASRFRQARHCGRKSGAAWSTRCPTAWCPNRRSSIGRSTRPKACRRITI